MPLKRQAGSCELCVGCMLVGCFSYLVLNRSLSSLLQSEVIGKLLVRS